MMGPIWRLVPILAGLLLVLLVLASSVSAQVTFERILNADNEPHNWLTYSGTYASQRYSQLSEITPANAKDLELKWVFQARWMDYYQTTPLVVDGIMYLTQRPNDVLAVDAKTGQLQRAPKGRSIGMAVVGGLAALWAFVTLVAG
jgi:glucose dehydrogenase